MIKQKIDKSEPYFTHIGYTYAKELRKTKLKKAGGRYIQLPIKDSKHKFLKKLRKYWRLACR